MNFEALRQRVQRAELVVAVRVEKTRSSWFTLSSVWRAGWTPLRIITVGLAGGFLAGKLEPTGLGAKVQGARWLQMIGSVSNLVASTQAAFASMQASEAADTAEQAADKVDDAADQAPRQAAPAPAPPPATPRLNPERRAEPASPHQPQPAEAATDLSER
ncbi:MULTISPECIES: protein sip-5 [Stenotrophomonas]|uniref:Protein sip-5 n=1 Tax=Stenotrophomonas bentonitica TaxID=1450134 RepID=A0ABU9JMY9_9GAMM|nr:MULTISPECIES: protein sip-5 [Stenotrophomonas]OFS90248.1 protein sip-5 [Stenotrophomonas sp. HMSC10F06]